VAERHFKVKLPEEVLTGFGWQESEVPRRVREALIMELVRLDRVSEAQAAEFLGLDRWEFLEVMGHYRVPAIRMNPEELKQELTMEIKRGERA
jgi:predicted HTH domain antitoxin